MTLQVTLNKPDIVTVIENEGVELKPKGKAYWALCPLHLERTPSFKVDPQRQSFYCFGCREHGDSIAFIQKYKRLSFKNALRYLGISKSRPYKPDPRELKKCELVKTFRQWCDEYHSDLCNLYRTLQKAKEKVKTIEDIKDLTEFYHKESFWLYQIEILQGDDDEAKLLLYKEVIYGS